MYENAAHEVVSQTSWARHFDSSIVYLIRRGPVASIRALPLQRYAERAVPPIHIVVNNGHVTLEGVVASEADKNIAGIQANSVPGGLLGYKQSVGKRRILNSQLSCTKTSSERCDK